MPRIKEPAKDDSHKTFSVIVMMMDLQGITRKQMAEKLVCSSATLVNDFRNPGSIPLRRFLRYCKAVGIPFSRILVLLIEEVKKGLLA